MDGVLLTLNTSAKKTSECFAWWHILDICDDKIQPSRQRLIENWIKSGMIGSFFMHQRLFLIARITVRICGYVEKWAFYRNKAYWAINHWHHTILLTFFHYKARNIDVFAFVRRIRRTNCLVGATRRGWKHIACLKEKENAAAGYGVNGIGKIMV